MWVQRNYILPETEKNLWGGLAADPAVQIGLVLKENGNIPELRDGVAEEHHPRFTFNRKTKFCVRLAILGQVGPVADSRFHGLHFAFQGFAGIGSLLRGHGV